MIKAVKTKTENGAVYHEYYVDLFKTWVSVVNTKSSIKKMMEHEGFSEDTDTFKGMTFLNENGEGIIIFLNKEKGADITTLAHELIHTTTFIYNRIGMEKSTRIGQDETEAYLMELLMDKFKHLI